jgi:UDP-glucose 4-epimerase
MGDGSRSQVLAARDAKATGPMMVGAGESVSVSDILDVARSVTGSELSVTDVPAKPGEMPAVVVDISRACSIGYEPEQDLKSGRTTVWPEFAEATQ